LSKLKDTDFLYISTHLRALENSLLTRERMERMLEARTNEDAARVLAECGYTGLEQLSPDRLSRSLSRAREETFSQLSALSPNLDIVDVFRIKYDYHNAKALIKCRALGRDASEMLIAAGRYPTESVSAAVDTGESGGLSSALSKAISQAQELLATSGDPQKSDLLLDRACYGELLETANRSGSTFLQGYVRLQIDAANLKSAVRSLRQHQGQDFIRRVLLPGGNVSPESIAAACLTGGHLEALFTGALQSAAALGDEISKEGRQTAFEKACDNALNAYLQSSRMVSFGDSILVAYVAAKENEITAARIILSGRMAGVPTEAIRERLRDAYV
jgi:V/A-type H+-transporting ATPase subunit C